MPAGELHVWSCKRIGSYEQQAVRQFIQKSGLGRGTHSIKIKIILPQGWVSLPIIHWDFHYHTMILQRIRIIVINAEFESGTFDPEVWCTTFELPHLRLMFITLIQFNFIIYRLRLWVMVYDEMLSHHHHLSRVCASGSHM